MTLKRQKQDAARRACDVMKARERRAEHGAGELTALGSCALVWRTSKVAGATMAPEDEHAAEPHDQREHTRHRSASIG